MSEEEVNAPIRLILFTKPNCAPCEPIKRLIPDVLRGGMMDEMVFYNEVDIIENPDVAQIYGIRGVPTIILNERIIARGGQNIEELRETLISEIFRELVAKQKDYEFHLEALMRITQNTLDSIMSLSPVRSNIGDYVHIGVLQHPLFSLLALDPLIPRLLYQAGKQFGIMGAEPFYISMLNPKVDRIMKSSERFPELIKGIALLFTKNDKLRLYYASSAEIVEITSTTADIRVYGLASSVRAIPLGEPIDHFVAGEIAGIIKAKMGQEAIVKEVHCYGMGDEFCQFHIQLLDDNEEVPELYPIGETDREAIKQRQEMFFGMLNELSVNMWDSVLYKTPIRYEILDITHISILQKHITALLLMDPFSGSLLYSAGRKLGEIGTGTNILYDYVEENGFSPPLSIGEATTVLAKYLQHPSIVLTREHSFVEVVESSYDRAVIRIYENAHAAGMPNIGKTLCHFTAGYFAGRIKVLMDDEVTVTERECFGTGKEYCEFVIEKF